MKNAYRGKRDDHDAQVMERLMRVADQLSQEELAAWVGRLESHLALFCGGSDQDV